MSSNRLELEPLPFLLTRATITARRFLFSVPPGLYTPLAVVGPVHIAGLTLSQEAVMTLETMLRRAVLALAGYLVGAYWLTVDA